MLHWRSRKLPRKAGSPQLVETYAASSAIVELAWMKALWESMSWKDYSLLTQRRLQLSEGRQGMPHVVRQENPSFRDPESTIVMDSKGLFDALDNELPQDDRKSALEVPIIVEFLRRINGRSRWVPHNKNPADALTKFKGAHMQPLIEMLKTGMYTLRGEREELETRANQKLQGSVPRHKISAVNSSSDEPRCPQPTFFVHVNPDSPFRRS